MNDRTTLYASFQDAWNSCGSVSEVVEKTGLKKSKVNAMAAYLRKHDVPLKAYPKGRKGSLTDWDYLRSRTLVQLEVTPENPFPGSDGVPTLMVHEPTAA